MAAAGPVLPGLAAVAFAIAFTAYTRPLLTCPVLTLHQRNKLDMLAP